MNLLAPLGLALGLTIPVVIVFYLLKVRRHDEEVSSTFLWDDLVRDLAAHEPLQRLRWNPLLLLQIAVLTLLTVAFARPFLQQMGEPPVHAVLLLDASASMQATDVQPSRFARAVQLARDTLGGLPESSLATIVLVGAHPEVLASQTGDRREAGRALGDAHPSGSAADMREALLLARSLGGDPDTRRIYLFTDGAFTLPEDLPEDMGWVSVQRVAPAATGNLAVTTITTRPDPRDNRRQQVFARVENFSDSPVQVTEDIALDGQTVEQRPLSLAPNGTADQVFEDLPSGARGVSVSLSHVAGTDALRLDDDAFAVLVQHKAAQVLLVSAGNPFLERAITLLPNVELSRISTRRYLGVEADRFDVVVFDSYLPPLLPRGNLLVINPPDRGAVPTSGTVQRPRVAGWQRDDPLLAYVDMGDLSVTQARRLSLADWARPLVTAVDGTPLLAVGQDGDRRMAVIPYDLRQSNLPLSPSFPILMSNLLGYLAPPGVVQSASVATGDPEVITPLPQIDRVRITGPQDRSADVKVGSKSVTFTGTDLPGLYRVQQIVADGEQTVDEDMFAANLASREESDIRPRLTGLDSVTGQPGEMVSIQHEVWLALAALALPLLLFEWFWFHRRT